MNSREYEKLFFGHEVSTFVVHIRRSVSSLLDKPATRVKKNEHRIKSIVVFVKKG